MDPLTQLYERLRAQAPNGSPLLEPPSYEQWLRFWDDEQTEIGNLRSYEHWLSQQLKSKARAA